MRRSVRILAAAALAWLGACTDAPPTTPSATPDAAARPASARLDARDRYIVVFEDRVARPADQAREMVRAHGGTLHFTYEQAVRGFAATLTPQAAEALRRNPNVRYVEPDQVVTAAATQNGAPSSLDRIDQRSLPLSGTYTYASGATGQGVNAYVVDSGIRFSHTQFGGRAVPAVDYVPDGGMGNDCTGHGTHVAGILGGSTYGVAKGVKLHSVRVIDCYNQAFMSAVVAGLDWVRLNHVKPAVVNLGFTGLYSLAQDDAVRALLAAGVTVVSPAGNASDDVCHYSSAYIDGVITAGATDASDTRWPGSNWGHCIDVFAPGVDITSAAYYDDNDVTVLTGTSMAAPHVAGAVARYLQTKTNATPAEAHAFIVNGATTGVVYDAGYLSPNRLLYVDPSLGGTPPSVTISGPSTISAAGTYTWSTSVTGGSGSYAYAWEYRTQGSATWTPVGTAASTYTRSVAAGNAHFELRVTVTSGGLAGSDNHLVNVNISTAPSVAISGPTTVSTAGTYTWTTSASGGNGTYTYAWEYRVQGGAWTSVGTASSYSRSVAAGNPAFELRVTVTSAGLTGSATHLVSVTIPTPLAASIVGPSYLDSGMQETWNANASGGTGTYTYQWQYRTASTTTWTNVGTGSSYTRITPRQSFYLRLTVTSGGVSVVDDHFVEVWVEPMCGQYMC
jgi:subtilisin family serine protease